ncbi:Uncharacterised protein [Serratia grimesii]|nr:Uncharacterised protein [Serratia grimesii]
MRAVFYGFLSIQKAQLVNIGQKNVPLNCAIFWKFLMLNMNWLLPMGVLGLSRQI